MAKRIYKKTYNQLASYLWQFSPKIKDKAKMSTLDNRFNKVLEVLVLAINQKRETEDT